MTYPLLETLQQEHRLVRDILTRLKEDIGATAEERTELWDNLKRNLMPHTRGEEKFFYPALINKEEARADTLEAIEEHHVIESLMAQMEGTIRRDLWDARLAVLKESVDHHVKEEESRLFRDAKIVLSPEQMDRILDNFAEERRSWLEGEDWQAKAEQKVGEGCRQESPVR